MRNLRSSVSLMALFVCGAASAQVTVPNTFVSGTPAKAADVNANFQAVVTAINALHSATTNAATKNQGCSRPPVHQPGRCPGITSVKLELWGGGGGGGSGYGIANNVSNCSTSGGGGGGGSYTRAVVAVTPGATYTLVIGQGGLAGAANVGSDPAATAEPPASPSATKP